MKRIATDLPAITETDLLERPHQLRKTPRGGWAWRCSTCKQYASSRIPSGELRCYQHGGTRSKERDAEARGKGIGERSAEQAKKPLRYGFYTNKASLRIEERVASYKAQGLDPDCTDDDMFYLRAHLEQLMAIRPDPVWVMQELEELRETYRRFEHTMTDEGMTMAQVMERVPETRVMREAYQACIELFETMLSFTSTIEALHHRIIRASKTRAETRLKTEAAQELEQFQVLMTNLLRIIQDNSPPGFYLALVKVLEKQMDEVPHG